MRRHTIMVTTLLILVGSGCAKSERVATERVSGAAASTDVAPLAQNRVGTPAASPRMVIRTAQLRLITSDTSKSVAELESVAMQADGYIENSRVWHDGDLTRATLTLRVPEARLREALRLIRKSAKRVDSEQLGGNDVSAEFVDLTAHLRNFEATEVELRSLLSTIRQRSQKASEVLEIHRELAGVRAEIERVKGRMNHLSTMTALATINLELIPDAAAQPAVRSGWEPLAVAKEATRATVATLQLLANAAIWLIIFVLPLVLLTAVTILVARQLLIRRRVSVQ